MRRFLIYVLAFSVVFFIFFIDRVGAEPEPRALDISTLRILFDPDGNPTYELQVSYEFKGADEIHMDGVGNLPAEASFSFLSPTKVVEFRDTKTGATIASVNARGKGIELPDFELPPIEAFPRAGKFYLWKTGPDFLTSLFEVLASLGFSYAPTEQGEKSHCVTDFVDLEGLPDVLKGRVAILLTYPSKKLRGPLRFQVSSIIQERRSKSGQFRPAVDSEVRAAGEQLVSSFVRKLNASRRVSK